MNSNTSFNLVLVRVGVLFNFTVFYNSQMIILVFSYLKDL